MAYQRIDLLEQQFANLGSFLENIMKVDKTNSKVDSLVSKESSGGYGESSTAKSRGKQHSGSSNFFFFFYKFSRSQIGQIGFPRYSDNEDPMSWVNCVEQFFEYQQTEDDEKISLSAYHLEGAA